KELQRALARLRLIRRVGAVELAARGDRPHGRGDMVLIRACADEAERAAVEACALAHEPPDFHFARGFRHPGQGGQTQAGRDLVEELLDAADPDGREHRLDILAGVRDEGHQPPSSAISFWYSSALMSAAVGAPPAGRNRISQPLPYASELMTSGAAASAGLLAVTSPAMGE